MKDTAFSDPSRVLVIGASGLLGTTLVPELISGGISVFSASGSGSGTDFKVDAREFSPILNLLQRIKPDFVVNLVSLTSVDECESNPQKALHLNSVPNLNISLARQVSGLGFQIVYLSTDHVYNSPGLSAESDEVALVNTYAATKFMGERALESGRDIVIRTNFVGKSRAELRESLTDWLVSVAKTQERAQVLSDVYFSPVSMRTVSAAISQVLRNPLPGLYNLGSTTSMSKADFDFEFLRAVGLPSTNFSRAKSEDVTFLKAQRPTHMEMDSSKFQDSFGFRLPTLEEVIQLTAKEYLE